MKISTEIWALKYPNFCVDIHHWFVDRERVSRLSPSPAFDTHAAMLAALRSSYTMRTKCAISDGFVRDCAFAYCASVAQYVYHYQLNIVSD